MNKLKNDFINQFVNSAPSNLLQAKEELEQWAHIFVSDWLAKHDLVTQQEFTVQQKILQRLRDQVTNLEEKLLAQEKNTHKINTAESQNRTEALPQSD
jgi:BMFP domain-containing protein YqiC